MNQIQVLASIYKILAESSKETLEHLSRSRNQPKDILTVVQALKNAKTALDAGKMQNNQYDKTVIQKKPIPAGKFDERRASWGPQSRRLWKSVQTALTDKKKHKLTNKDFVEAFLASGLDTNARSKEGKKKMLLLIERSLEALEDSKRIQILENVQSHLGLSQTKGYMEVIKSQNS